MLQRFLLPNFLHLLLYQIQLGRSMRTMEADCLHIYKIVAEASHGQMCIFVDQVEPTSATMPLHEWCFCVSLIYILAVSPRHACGWNKKSIHDHRQYRKHQYTIWKSGKSVPKWLRLWTAAVTSRQLPTSTWWVQTLLERCERNPGCYKGNSLYYFSPFFRVKTVFTCRHL